MASITSKVNSLATLAAKSVIDSIVDDLADDEDVKVEIDPIFDPFKMKKQHVHICMGIDSTASMASIIAVARDTANAIKTRLEKEDFDTTIDIASVNDWEPLIPIEDQKSPITWDVDIDTIQASGGGDAPEAYSVFIKESCERISKSDNESLRYIILLGDSYAHGMPPTQNCMSLHQDSYKDGDPNGDTIPQCMRYMKRTDSTFIMVQATECSEQGKLWAASNAKYTDGTVIPMCMDDMDKVPNILSTYIVSQTSMVATILKKRAEMKNKSTEEIAKMLADHMKEEEENSVEISETVEHSAADEFINSVEDTFKHDDSESGKRLYREFSKKLNINKDEEWARSGSFRMASDGTVSKKSRLSSPSHYRGEVSMPVLTREVSSNIEFYKANENSQAIKRASMIASKRMKSME